MILHQVTMQARTMGSVVQRSQMPLQSNRSKLAVGIRILLSFYSGKFLPDKLKILFLKGHLGGAGEEGNAMC